ncbi:conserved hypothetical protein [Desulfovibrionales bacterium]
MSYDIRLVRLVSGEIVLGKYDSDAKKIKDVAILQTASIEQGVQMMLMPFGYPFEQTMVGEISLDHVIYQYKTFPEELKTRYLEAISNITLSPASALRNLDLAAKSPIRKAAGLSGIIK